MENSDDAGVKLARARESLYGLHPNPTMAFSQAIKAVEDAAIPVVIPKSSKATLGTVVNAIYNQTD